MVNGGTLFLYFGVPDGPILVMDGIDCASGQRYVYEKFPIWGYLFIVLNAINLTYGLWGILFTVLGIWLTVWIIENSRYSKLKKVLLCILSLVGCYILMQITLIIFAAMLYFCAIMIDLLEY